MGYELVNTKIKTSGYVFCMRIGKHKKPWFRFVPVDDSWTPLQEDGNQVVYDDMLASLVAADPVTSTVK